MKHAPTRLIHIALCLSILNQHVINSLDLRTLVTIKARFAIETMYMSLVHVAVGFLLVAGGVMDAAGASCSYMMEGDFQSC